MLSRVERLNIQVVLYRLRQHAASGDWPLGKRRLVCRLAVCCVLTESSGLIYANSGVPASLELYHDAIGHNHESVGLYQQQVPMWGTAEACMDPIRSTDKFCEALMETVSLSEYRQVSPWQMIQEVQRSAFQDGSNYRQNWGRACGIVRRNRRYWL